MRALPDWLLQMLDTCPVAGNGVHLWLPRLAHYLHAFYDERSMCELLKEKTRSCGRTVPENEILKAIRFAKACAWKPEATPEQASGSDNNPPAIISLSQWPKPDPIRIKEIVDGGWSLYDLWERSPNRLESGGSHAEEIADLVFPDNPFLCCGETNYKFATRRREAWRGSLERLSLIVPNPKLSARGRTQTGKLSEHTKQSTGKRTYLVAEFDFSEFARNGKTETEWTALVREWRASGITVADACAALHLHLAERLPLLLVVHSANKSLHGWYSAFNFTDIELRPLMDYAVQLGADPATWCRSQFVRLPDGTRENGDFQTTYYFDPEQAVK
jgi:hypothetical protein